MKFLKSFLFKLLAAVSVLVVVAAPQVSAFTQNDFDCANNTTCFYEPCSNPAVTSTTGDSSSVVGQEVPDDQLPGANVKEKIWNYLIAQGYTPVQAAGIMGNAYAEGVYDPQSIEDGDEKIDPSTGKLVGRTKNYEVFKQLTTSGQDGYGLFGFTPGLSLMKPNIGGQIDFAGISKVNVTKDNFYFISTQLDVAYGYMKNSPATDGSGSLLDQFQKGATSASAAADSWESTFEHADPAVAHDSKREHQAGVVLKKFGKGGASTTTGTTGTTGDSGSSGSSGSGTQCCDTPSQDPSTADLPVTGDIQSLAQQVLKNNNITFDYGPGGPVAANFKLLANGDEAQTDTGRHVDVQPIILVALLSLAQDHKVQVSSLTDGSSHVSPSDPHGMGDAMDLDFIDGTELNNSSAVVKTVNGLQLVLPKGSRFGMGNPSLLSQTTKPGDYSSFFDNPNSVHFDVVGVSQQDDDSAVQAAGGGSDDSTAPTPATSGQCCASTGTTDFGTGTLPPSVPKPYNAIFTAAANKFNISPALLAGIFYGGEHGGSWPVPPPPYGNGQPWATSRSAGAEGPFQFLPSTWAGYEQDGNGDGKKDIQDLADAAFGAADYLAASGAKLPNPDLQKAIFAYNHAQFYVDDVMAAYTKFGGASAGGAAGAVAGGGDPATTGSADSATCGSSASTGTYQNPLRDVMKNGSLVAHRIDEGVDYGGHGDVYAVGDGVVSFAGSGYWFSAYGESVVYKLTDGPAQGRSVYFSESCTPAVKPGDKVTSDTVICHMHGDDSPWVETGWAEGGSHEDEPMAGPAYGAVPDGSKMVYGVNFSQLLVSLGAPAGNSVPGAVSTNPGTTVGTLPGDWPTWGN